MHLGFTVKEIAVFLRCNPQVIVRIANKLSVKYKPKGSGRTTCIKPKQAKKIIETFYSERGARILRKENKMHPSGKPSGNTSLGLDAKT